MNAKMQKPNRSSLEEFRAETVKDTAYLGNKRKRVPSAIDEGEFLSRDEIRQRSMELSMKAYDEYQTKKALQKLEKYEFQSMLNRQWENIS